MPFIPREISDEIEEEDPEFHEYLSELGRETFEHFDTEALHRMIEELDKRGYKEVADNIEQWFYVSEEYWAQRYWEETGDVIMYDPDVRRWRSMLTGQFVKDPYKYLWYE